MLNGDPCGLDQLAEPRAGEARDDPKTPEPQSSGHDVRRRGIRMAERRNARNASWAQDPGHLGETSSGIGK